MTSLEQVVRPFAQRQGITNQNVTPGSGVIPYSPGVAAAWGKGGSPQTYQASFSTNATKYMENIHGETTRTLQNYKITNNDDPSISTTIAVTTKLETLGPNGQTVTRNFNKKLPDTEAARDSSGNSTVTKDGSEYVIANI